MQLLARKVMIKFKIMKIRMKISFMAFQKCETIYELMMKTIYDVYNHRKNQGLIETPWPTVTKGCFKRVMRQGDEESDEDEEDEQGNETKIKKAEKEYEEQK